MRKIWGVGVGVAVLAIATLVVGCLFGAEQVGSTVWAAEANRAGLLAGQVVEMGDTSLLARIALIRPARRLQEYFVRGTVAALDDSRVTVDTGNDGIATLFITDTTRMWVPGEVPTATVELAVGDPVLALGEPMTTEAGEKALSARLVVVVSDEDLPKVLIQGRAVAITQQTIVVRTRRGERAMTVLPRTRILSTEGRLDSLDEIRPGEQIVALGQPTEFGQWIAGLVLMPGPRPLADHVLRGQVKVKEAQAGTLTVETKYQGEITVLTSDQTRYRIPGVEDPGLADIQVGDTVVVVGRFEAGSQSLFLARGVGVVAPSAGE